jgi:hypothetical protein
MKHCPFVSGKKTDYRGELPAMEGQSLGRPDKMLLMRGFTSKMKLVTDGSGAVIYAGKILKVVEEI